METGPSGGAALITGAAGGIGTALARGLAKAGRRLVLVDRDAHLLDGLAKELGPDTACPLAMDVTDGPAVDRILSRVPDTCLPIHTLINNAGHDIGGTKRFDLGEAEDWTNIIQTNLIGLMRMTRAILPEMVKRNHGDVVNIGSIAGIRLVPDMAAYTASKAGVHAFSDVLRADLRETAVRVTEILPGLTRTDIIRKRYKGDEARAREYFARFEMALDPEDIARAALFALNTPGHATVAQIVVLPTNRW